MKKYYPVFDSSTKSLSQKPNTIMSAFVLFVVISFCLFHLGKDCANYDKRQAVNSTKTR